MFSKISIFFRKGFVRVIIKKIFITLVALSVFLSLFLVFAFVTNLRREAVLSRVPSWIKSGFSQISESYSATKNWLSDLTYAYYWFEKSELPVYDIYVSQDNLQKMSDVLPTTYFTDGRQTVLSDDSKVYQSAKFKYSDKEYNVGVRYRGDMPVHWIDNKKSWRVEFSADDLFEGQESIDLILPENRLFFAEYLNNYRAKKMGLKNLRTDFVILRVNNKVEGVYYKIEHWGKEFLEINELTGDTNFYGEDGMYVPLWNNIFAWKKYTEDVTNAYSNYAELEKMVDLLNNASDSEFYKKIWDLIDEDSYYKWQVQATLAGSMHQDYHHNMRLYFDNTTGKFVFIPWDVFFFNIQQHMNKIGAEDPYDYINRNPLNIRILKNQEFLAKRNQLLWNYVSDDSNIKDDLAAYDAIYKKTKIAFYKDFKKIFSNKYFDQQVAQMRKVVESNFKILKSAIKTSVVSVKTILNKNYDLGERTPLRFDFFIKSYSPVSVRDIEFSSEDFKTFPTLYVYYDKNDSGKVDSGSVLMGYLKYDSSDKTYHFKESKHVDFYTDRIWGEGSEYAEGGPEEEQTGLEETEYSIIVASYDYSIPEIKNPTVKLILENSISGDKVDVENKVFINGNEFSYFDYISMSANEFLSYYPIFTKGAGDKVTLPAGSYTITKNIIVPKDLELEIMPGTTMYFAKGISLISYSPVSAIGTASAPITITSVNSGEARGTFAVVGAGSEKSYFHYVTFEYGGTEYINGAFFSGALALHSSDVEIKYSQFKYATCDDGLNVKNAKAEIYGSLFYKNSMDGIDFDFIKSGTVSGNKFIENGGDGFDISGSDVLFTGNTVSKSGDKCVSVGEKSKSTISNNYLDGCVYGIAVKDLSEPVIIGNTIINNKVGISAYQKKQIFGGGFPKVGSNTLTNNEKDTETDAVSKIVDYNDGNEKVDN